MALWPLVRAKHYRRGRRRPVRAVVIHTMESGETATTAEGVARYFAGGTVVASAHFNVDNNSVVQSVKGADTAFAAPGLNADGLHIELAGRAGQSAADWSDAYSEAVLNWGALVAAECIKACAWYGVVIPIRKLTPQEVAAGQRGLCGHVDVSRAYRKSSHWDPGPNFPWEKFLGKVRWWLAQDPPIQFR